MFVYRSEAGEFAIIPDSGRWHMLFEEELLGTYTTPEQAASDLSMGHVFAVTSGIDFAKLGLPRDLSRWERTN